MAVSITRKHGFAAGDVDSRMDGVVEHIAASHSLSIIEKSARYAKVAGMGVTGEVRWDESEITVKADMVFAFGAADTQLQTAIEGVLDSVCAAGEEG